MKKIVFFLLTGCFSLFCLSSSAQAKKDLATMRIKTSVECQMCKKRIEDYFKRETGVQYVNVNYRNKIVTVRYMPSRITPSYILTDIANLGYDADSVKANPDFYAKLPACCKKGGMEKLKEEKLKARKLQAGKRQH
jgi:cation transport ATPase